MHSNPKPRYPYILTGSACPIAPYFINTTRLLDMLCLSNSCLVIKITLCFCYHLRSIWKFPFFKLILGFTKIYLEQDLGSRVDGLCTQITKFFKTSIISPVMWTGTLSCKKRTLVRIFLQQFLFNISFN